MDPGPLILSGDGLTLTDLVDVARDRRRAELAAGALERVGEAWAAAEAWVAGGHAAYGFTSGVGGLTSRDAPQTDRARFNDIALAQHRIAFGPDLPADVVRAGLVVLLNGLARGLTAVRPQTVERLVGGLAQPSPPAVRSRGSVGQGDLGPLADLAHAVVPVGGLEGGELLALIGGNALSTGAAALAASDAAVTLSWATTAAALSMEGLLANLSVLDPLVEAARPGVGVATVRGELVALLAGSALWDELAPRRLQDALTVRTVPQLHGAARDAVAQTTAVVTAECNATQNNPLVDRPGRRLVSAGSFDGTALVLALDGARQALGVVVTASAERAIKLLQTGYTGLVQGLTGAGAPEAEAGLAELGVSVQALASEARLLAAPVALELTSTTQAGGVEDRTTMAGLAARRLQEQVELIRLVLAVELVVAAQAVDLRPARRLGEGTGCCLRAVRSLIPVLRAGDPLPAIDRLAQSMAQPPGTVLT